MCFTKYKYPNRLKVEGWKKTYHANTHQKKAEVTVSTSDSKVRAKTITRDTEVAS